jgi:Na+-driven multidrug efflux pump
VGRGFLQALAATAVVAALLVCLLLAAPEQLLGFFQTNAEVMPHAKTYCMIRCAAGAHAVAAARCSSASYAK